MRGHIHLSKMLEFVKYSIAKYADTLVIVNKNKNNLPSSANKNKNNLLLPKNYEQIDSSVQKLLANCFFF